MVRTFGVQRNNFMHGYNMQWPEKAASASLQVVFRDIFVIFFPSVESLDLVLQMKQGHEFHWPLPLARHFFVLQNFKYLLSSSLWVTQQVIVIYCCPPCCVEHVGFCSRHVTLWSNCPSSSESTVIVSAQTWETEFMKCLLEEYGH